MPTAGQKVAPKDLINIPQLIADYYTQRLYDFRKRLL